jgi:hypothetical protein
MIKLKEVVNKATKERAIAIKWDGKNEDVFLAISKHDVGSHPNGKEINTISSYPLLGWLFFPNVNGETLIRRNGWLVREVINHVGIWSAYTGGMFKQCFTIVGELDNDSYDLSGVTDEEG